MRKILMLLILVLGLGLSASSGFADTLPIDPFIFDDPNVGFCPPPATQSACTTGTGLGTHTIAVGTTSFGMLSNGKPSASAPWYLLLSVPELTAHTATAPTITSGSFTQSGSRADAGAFGRTTAGDIYAFAAAYDGGLKGDSSMNAANMFCDGAVIPCASSNEIKAFGSLPKYFEIFVYTFTPGFNGLTPYAFNASPGMVSGTYLAALGGDPKHNNVQQFSTPFTTTGLAEGPHTPVPEPALKVMLGISLLGAFGLLRKKLNVA